MVFSLNSTKSDMIIIWSDKKQSGKYYDSALIYYVTIIRVGMIFLKG